MTLNDRLRAAAELAAALAENASHSPLHVATDTLALLQLGRRAKGIALKRANGVFRDGRQQWEESDDKAADKAEARILAAAQSIAAEYGATVEVGGDPRGYTLRLNLASGRSNGWGKGWGV